MERAADAALTPAWGEHEMTDNQLAAVFKQFDECDGALGAIEGVGVFDFDPGQRAASGGNCIVLPRQFLFARKKLLTSCEPVRARPTLRALADSEVMSVSPLL